MLKFIKDPSNLEETDSSDSILSSLAIHLLNHAKQINDNKTNIVEIANAFNSFTMTHSKMVNELMDKLSTLQEKVSDLEAIAAKNNLQEKTPDKDLDMN